MVWLSIVLSTARAHTVPKPTLCNVSCHRSRHKVFYEDSVVVDIVVSNLGNCCASESLYCTVHAPHSLHLQAWAVASYITCIMTLPLQDTVIVITGASSGIGLATSIKLAALGANLALCDINLPGLLSTLPLLTPRYHTISICDVRANMLWLAFRSV